MSQDDLIARLSIKSLWPRRSGDGELGKTPRGGEKETERRTFWPQGSPLPSLCHLERIESLPFSLLLLLSSCLGLRRSVFAKSIIRLL